MLRTAATTSLDETQNAINYASIFSLSYIVSGPQSTKLFPEIKSSAMNVVKIKNQNKKDISYPQKLTGRDKLAQLRH